MNLLSDLFGSDRLKHGQRWFLTTKEISILLPDPDQLPVYVLHPAKLFLTQLPDKSKNILV